jgi:hypothetical protein
MGFKIQLFSISYFMLNNGSIQDMPFNILALQKHKKQMAPIETILSEELPGTACLTTTGMNKLLKSSK